MVDLAAAAIAATPTLSALPWADLGTGSGALAIGMARLLQQQQQQQNCAAVAAPAPSAQQPCVYAVDLSPTAAAYAAANASAHGVQDTVHVLQGSWFEPLQQAALHGKLGGVLSNPPYIPQAQLQEGLQAEVAQHEPLSALDGGLGAGMDSLRVSAACAKLPECRPLGLKPAGLSDRCLMHACR
jgi:release factor glutamine methyltransferase